MKRFVVIFATALFVLSFSAAAFAADPAPAAAPAAPAAGAPAAPAEPPGPKVGPNVGNKIAPFKLTDANKGGTVSLETLTKSGKDSIIIFMQTACSLCVAEVSDFIQANEDLQGNVNVVLVSVDYDEKRIPPYAKAYNIPFPIGHDKEATLLEALRFGSTPCMAIIDKDGIIKSKYEGYDKNKVKIIIKEYSK